MAIHATAIIDKSAEIHPDAEIGAYAIIEGHVRIGAGTRVYPHGYVSWGTTLGERVEVHPHAVVGHLPQDVKFTGAPSNTVDGDGTVIREGATIHRGTVPDSTTVVGRNCMIMATGHVGHNCVVGDNVTIANSGLLAGHVQIGERAFVSGCAAVHQFVRIGALVMLGGGTRSVNDVPPYMLVSAQGVASINVVGMRRAGLSAEERLEVRRAHRLLYRSGLTFPAAVAQLAEMVRTDAGRRVLAFLREPSRRGFMRFRGAARHAESVAEEAE